MEMLLKRQAHAVLVALSSSQSCAFRELFFCSHKPLYPKDIASWNLHLISVYQRPKVHYLIIFRLHSFDPKYYFIFKSIGMVSNAGHFLSLPSTNQSIQSEAEKNKFVFLVFQRDRGGWISRMYAPPRGDGGFPQAPWNTAAAPARLAYKFATSLNAMQIKVFSAVTFDSNHESPDFIQRMHRIFLAPQM